MEKHKSTPGQWQSLSLCPFCPARCGRQGTSPSCPHISSHWGAAHMHTARECTWAKAIGAIDDMPAGVYELDKFIHCLSSVKEAKEAPVPVVMERWLSPLKYYSVTSQQLLQKPVPETCVGPKNGRQSRESGFISAILSIKERQCYCLLGWLYFEFFNSNVALQYVTKANSLFWFSHPLLCDLPVTRKHYCVPSSESAR